MARTKIPVDSSNIGGYTSVIVSFYTWKHKKSLESLMNSCLDIDDV